MQNLPSSREYEKNDNLLLVNHMEKGLKISFQTLYFAGGSVSRILYRLNSGLYHLSNAAYPPATSEQLLTAGILGLAGDWSYPNYVAIISCGLLPRIFTLTP